jgi:hypothetical protein
LHRLEGDAPERPLGGCGNSRELGQSRGIFTPDVLSLQHIMDFDEDNSPRPVEAELDVEMTKG